MSPLDLTHLAAAHWAGARAASPTPEPADLVPDTPPDELVTPGTIGFLVTFAVAVCLVLLVRDMNRRVRRVRVRSDLADAQLRRELAEEQAREARAVGTDGTDGTDGEGPRTRTGEPLTGGDAPGGHREPPAAPNG